MAPSLGKRHALLIAVELPPGTPIGPFRVEGLLGRGATAVVYRATREADGLAVALKIPEAAVLLRDKNALGRHEREARIAATLDVPGVVRLVDAGASDGRPWLAYELVAGARPLDEAWVGRSPLERARLVLDAARALGAAHARGVVHRDVKPSNVLVDDAGVVRIADLGLAWTTGDPALTLTGAALGTPRWLAPEVALAGSRAATAPTNDVWALGALLFLAFTGRHPAEGRSLADLEGAAAPSARALVPDLAPELDAVVRRALDPSPAARFQDGSALASALDAALAEAATTASARSRRSAARPGGVWGSAAAGSSRTSPAGSARMGTPAPTPGPPILNVDTPEPVRPHDTGRAARPADVRTSGGRSSPLDAPLGAGDRLGPYRLVSLLGKGGMGQVFRARDEALDRDVAVKVLPASAADARRDRFAREVEAACRVEHPNIVAVHAAGEEPSGRRWLATALVEGDPLDRLVARGPLEPRRAAAMARGVASALEALHRGGVVHRDVKPANILVDADGEPRLTDFGIARLEGAARLTGTLVPVGTPLYMAPEQLEGEPGDAQADIYALGATLWEMLTGRPPFSDAPSIEVVSYLKTKGAPPTGAERDLDGIVRRAMDPLRGRRHASAAELAADLEDWLAGRAIARPVRSLPGLAALRGPRAAGGLAAALAVALLTVLGLALSRGARAEAPGQALEALRRTLAARAAEAPRLADVETSAEAAQIAALASRAPASDSGAMRAAAEAMAWVGLTALARGDADAAEEAAAWVAGDPRPVAAALRAGLLVAPGRQPTPADGARALLELTRAGASGLRWPELTAWRAAAIVARGSEGLTQAEEALAALDAAAGLGFDLGAAGRAARARALAALGRREEAEAALLALGPGAPPDVAWSVARFALEDELARGDLAAARARLETTAPPPGAPPDLELAGLAIDRVAPMIDRLTRDPTVPREALIPVCQAIEIHARLAPGRLPPRPTKFLRLWVEGPIVDTPACLALAAADAFPDDPRVIGAALLRAHGVKTAEEAARMEALARRALGRLRGQERWVARAVLPRVLAFQTRWAEAVRAAVATRVEACDAAARGEVEPAFIAVLAVDLQLVEAGAFTALGDPVRSLRALFGVTEAAGVREAEVIVERQRALMALGREAEAFATGMTYWERPAIAGQPRKTVAEVTWCIGEARARWADLEWLLAALQHEGLGSDDEVWALRRAIVKAGLGDGASAAALLEPLHLLGPKPRELIDRIRRGDASALQSLRTFERQARGPR